MVKKEFKTGIRQETRDTNKDTAKTVKGIRLLTKFPYRVGQPRTLVFGAFATLFVAIASIPFFYGCQKGSTSQNTLQENTSLAERKAKTSKIKKIKGSWHWKVFCEGVYYRGGIENSKGDAKYMVEITKCPESKATSSSIWFEDEDLCVCFEAILVNDQILCFDVIDPWTDTLRRITRNEISANALAWISEIGIYDEATLSQADKVVSQLKVWGIYLGGDFPDEIRVLHNLTAEQFETIATISWEEVTITQKIKDNGTIHLDWIFGY
jgi:hypothetical protein